jgi:hypothetical protein
MADFFATEQDANGFEASLMALVSASDVPAATKKSYALGEGIFTTGRLITGTLTADVDLGRAHPTSRTETTTKTAV